MDGISPEIKPYQAVTQEQVNQIQNEAPVARERANKRKGSLIDISKMVEPFHELRNPSEGQKLMAKTAATDVTTEDGETKRQPRPPGFAILFSPRYNEDEQLTSDGEKQYRNKADAFFRGGASVFTSPVKIEDQGPAYVGVDKKGVFILKASQNSNPQELMNLMLKEFDAIGDQTENYLLVTESMPTQWAEPKQKYADKMKFERLPQELAEKYVQAAAAESKKAPFISTVDASHTTPAENPKPVEQKPISDTNPHVDISKIEF
jgi:hypothetical protein